MHIALQFLEKSYISQKLSKEALPALFAHKTSDMVAKSPASYHC